MYEAAVPCAAHTTLMHCAAAAVLLLCGEIEAAWAAEDGGLGLDAGIGGGVFGVYGGEDGEEGRVCGEVLGCGREGGAGADCEFLGGWFGGDEGEEGGRGVYWVLVDVLVVVSWC